MAHAQTSLLANKKNFSFSFSLLSLLVVVGQTSLGDRGLLHPQSRPLKIKQGRDNERHGTGSVRMEDMAQDGHGMKGDATGAHLFQKEGS
jgi:hypothetical protein